LAVKVTTQRDGPVTRFYVEKNELCEITMSFDVDLQNLTSEAQFPYTATFPAGKVTEAFVLTPTGANTNWEFSYTNYYKLGSSCARHDENAVYRLLTLLASATRFPRAMTAALATEARTSTRLTGRCRRALLFSRRATASW
jgi:hypothetical protein